MMLLLVDLSPFSRVSLETMLFLRFVLSPISLRNELVYISCLEYEKVHCTFLKNSKYCKGYSIFKVSGGA